MKQAGIFIITLIFFSFDCKCQDKKSDSLKTYYIDKTGNWVFQRKSTKQVIGNKYFDYDEILHFEKRINFSRVSNLYFGELKTKIDSMRNGVYFKNIPNDISDSSVVFLFKKLGYKKSFINKSKFKDIDQIFIEKNVEENVVSSCIYIYRDILVFKKVGKIVGIAKICFECSANKIVGTLSKTENFGQDGDYERLKKILRRTNNQNEYME